MQDRIDPRGVAASTVKRARRLAMITAASAALCAAAPARAQAPAPLPAPAPMPPPVAPMPAPAAPPPGPAPAFVAPAALAPAPRPGVYPMPPPGYPMQPGAYPMYVVVPSEMDWEPGQPIPPGFQPDTRVRLGFVLSGAVTLGVVWLGNVVVASLTLGNGNGSETAPLFAPVLGPFIAIGTIGPSALTGLGVFWLAFDGVVQGAGAGLLIAGLAAPRHVLVPTFYAGKVSLVPTPMSLGKTGQGFGLTGTF
jgi:hypothetical protein